MAVKRYFATQDNTITNAFRESLLESQRGTGSNMGAADVLETFSIYGEVSGALSSAAEPGPGGYSSGYSQELSRIIIQFPVDQISTDRTAGLIPASGSMSFYLRMFNAKHTYTLPRNFILSVRALSQSWQEGTGLDMEEYKDVTYGNSGSNWINASGTNANGIGTWDTVGGHYHVTPEFTDSFPEGYEDLELDVSLLVEQWIRGDNGTTGELGGKTNCGVGVHFISNQEAYFSSSTGANTGSLLNNVTGATFSYYTKKFFSRSSEYFFKRPVLEARWNSAREDDRGNFYYSSSLAPGPDNLNTLYLYNYIRGRLVDIPIIGTTGSLMVSLYSGSSIPTGSRLDLYDGTTSITGGWFETGIYTASVSITASTSTSSLTKIFDVWHSGTFDNQDAIQYYTSSIAPKRFVDYNNNPTFQYVTSVTNLKSVYNTSETARFRLFIREKNWSPTIYTVATAQVVNSPVVSASYKLFRMTDNLNVIAYGTGSDKQTMMSYDVSGNYFDLNMSMLEKGYAYGIKVSYYNDTMTDWVEQPEVFKFRVEED